eukprot:scaffold871_cov224-Chaetoceros_neogracile.AAC.1
MIIWSLVVVSPVSMRKRSYTSSMIIPCIETVAGTGMLQQWRGLHGMRWFQIEEMAQENARRKRINRRQIGRNSESSPPMKGEKNYNTI